MSGQENPQAIKVTKQRLAIKEIFEQTDGFLSSQQVYEVISRSKQRVSIATIYRNLQLLAQHGELETVLSEDGETLYRKCDISSHHHHLVCRLCGRGEDISGKELESWIHQVSSQHNFRELTHRIEIFGICQNCDK